MRCVFVYLLLASTGCAGLDDDTQQALENVLTLQSGTISDLKAMRGSGPFETYPVPPEEMLLVVRDAARKARGLGDRPVRAIFVSDYRSEVVAKEREPDESTDDTYDGAFRTAMVATVHKVIGKPKQSRLEIHSAQRGPFHRGAVQWQRDMPRWIDEVLAEREQGRVREIP